MPRLEARPFQRQDIPEAASLLAARHRRDRARLPMLAGSFEDKDACAATIERLASNPRAAGAVALDAGRVAGFMFGEKQLHAPESFVAMFFPPYTMAVPVEGHAADAEGDVSAIYRTMYAFMAADWTRSGFFHHEVRAVAGDAEVQEAWVALGFGRVTTAAVRDTSLPVEGASAEVEMHDAGSEDIDVVMHLNDELFLHHSQSPIYWPMLRETAASAREYQAHLIETPGNAHWVAYQGGRPLGMQTFVRPGYTPPIVEPEGTTYLLQGVVEPDIRGGGVGSAILAHSMAWCRAQGYERCCLHFASANPQGGPFWLSNHFIPVEHTMMRHVDERVAWANH